MLVYIVEGGERMRAHDGTCYIYSDGAFTNFTGIVTEATLMRIGSYMLRLEGLCRLLDGRTTRKDEDVLEAIDKAVRDLCAGTEKEAVSYTHLTLPTICSV